MTTAKRTTPGRTKAKRGQGRPLAGKNDVGRDRLIAAAERLLRKLPPARVTIARVAQEASADPALVRYYFGDRTALLVAVADHVTKHDASHVARRGAGSNVALADHVRMTLAFTRSAPFMRRLMIEELADAGNDESRSRVRAMHRDLVAFYRRALKTDGGRTMQQVDPLFLHLMVLGACDFFATAEPLIREVVPRNANFERLAVGFREFLVKMVVDGLRRT